jgi:Domain of unknown function (DUF4262)
MEELQKSRVARLRETKLEADEKKLVDDVEANGWHLTQVLPRQPIPSWSYTIGLYETLQQPELIVVGLEGDLAHYLLNEVARRMKGGMRSTDGHREKELLESVECEFRKVEPRWVRHVMGYALWFYGAEDFPVFQCVYPDRKNHFPWEVEFDGTCRDRQPLLFQGAGLSAAETEFWAANDPSTSIFDWKFPDSPHTGVYTTKRIVNGEEPILYVFHDADDGAWQFHGPSASTPNDVSLVHFHHIIDKDPTIKELADLKRGWRARREKPSDAWVREQIAPL